MENKNLKRAIEVCKNMFLDYSGLQADLKIVYEDEYETDIFTMDLYFQDFGISGVEINFNECTVIIEDDDTTYTLGEFNKETLEFERSDSFFEALFLNIIY